MTKFALRIRRHRLLLFFGLALGLTWTAFIPWYASKGEDIPWFTFGPLLAALIAALLTGGLPALRSVLASMVRWRVSPVWYVVALGFPIAAQLVAISLNTSLGSAAPAWGNIPPLAEILPMVAIFAIFSGPLGEEPGWRGFAVPRLLASHSAFSASLLLGAVWAAWHLPLALVGDLTLYGTINVLLAAFVFTWLYQNTGGSVLLAILMHASHQNSVRYLGKVFSGGDFVQQQWIAVGIWLAAVVAILLVQGTSSFARRPETRSALLASA